MSLLQSNILTNAAKLKQARSARVSSWDQTGKNNDCWIIKPNDSVVLADLEGPGAITHLWFVQTCSRIQGPSVVSHEDAGMGMGGIDPLLGLGWETKDPDFYRKIVLKMFWDNQETPSVIAPLGDFFCVGNSMVANFQSMPFTVSVNPNQQHKYGGDAAFNCYLTMPFNKRARIEVENQNDVPYTQYFYIDYELYPKELPEDTLYFHAHWRRENPTKGWGPNLQTNSKDTQIANLDGKENYVVLETEGQGNYIGCNLSVTHFQGTWWGEGDDMIFVDDDFDIQWPPSFHGTGGEDYLGQGWRMQKNAYPFCGSIIHEDDVPNTQVSYRWHLTDPIRFNRKIKVSLEHGHANHLSDDWASTAYWYQKLPSPSLDILPVEYRIPRKVGYNSLDLGSSPSGLSEEQREMHTQHQTRLNNFLKEREDFIDKRAKESKAWEANNIKLAQNLHQRFLDSFK